MILIYLLVAARGFKIALMADDGFSKLLAAGLTAVFAIQAFVIIGGVTRVIPLTGVTLPFVSYGGSSIVANFVLLALLLLISDRARREAAGAGRHAPGGAGRERPDRQAVRPASSSSSRVLVGFTSYWSVFDAEALKDKQANKRPLLEQQQIERGRILAADGTVIARSVREGQGSETCVYVRRYPEGGAVRPPDRLQLRRAGRQSSSRSSTTTSWSARSPSSPRSSTSCGAARRRATTSSPRSIPSAQRIALDELARPAPGPWWRSSRRPARSGCMASYPPYRPEPVPDDFAQLNTRPGRAAAQPRDPGQLPAGLDVQGGHRRRRRSTAATITPDTTINATRDLDRSGLAARKRLRRQDFGPIGLDHGADQLGQHLVSPSSAEELGTETLFEYMDRFGFNSKPADRPARRTSSRPAASTTAASLLGPDDPVDIGRVAIGQERLLVTPLQMAEVAAAVANGGRADEARSSGTGSSTPTAAWSSRMDPNGPVRGDEPETAAELNEAMQGVVSEGTGTAAALPGVDGRRQDRHRGGPGQRGLRRRSDQTRPGSSASRRPTIPRSRSRRRSSAPPVRRRRSRRRSSDGGDGGGPGRRVGGDG